MHPESSCNLLHKYLSQDKSKYAVNKLFYTNPKYLSHNYGRVDTKLQKELNKKQGLKITALRTWG